MSIEISVSPEKYNRLLVEGFDSALGFWFWNIAVLITPYDTGAARSAISLRSNKPRKIRVSYDTFRALHIKFLEEGQGPVKKYKDFIKKDTTEAITEQLVSWIITGNRPAFARSGVRPFVKLKTSKYTPFSKERNLLKQANMNSNVITAKARMQISKIRELEHSGIAQRATGRKVETTTSINYKRNNKNISVLNQIYKDRVSQINK